MRRTISFLCFFTLDGEVGVNDASLCLPAKVSFKGPFEVSAVAEAFDTFVEAGVRVPADAFVSQGKRVPLLDHGGLYLGPKAELLVIPLHATRAGWLR